MSAIFVARPKLAAQKAAENSPASPLPQREELDHCDDDQSACGYHSDSVTQEARSLHSAPSRFSPQKSSRLLKQSQDWEASRAYLLEKSEARAWVIVRIAAVLAILSLAALIILVPFYKVIPVTFFIDKTTNEIMQVNTGKEAIPQSEAMDKYWLAQYVGVRERYVWTLLQTDFDTTIALSDERVANEYRTIFEGDNALDKKLGDSTDMRVKILSIELLPTETGKASVSWERTLRKNGIDVERSRRFISTISYKYIANAALSTERQIIANPFGFRVDGYAVSSVLNADITKPHLERKEASNTDNTAKNAGGAP